MGLHLQSYQRRSNGFTIVELLIIIVVIAVLSALVIVSFNGINDRARQTALLSDLSQAAKAIQLDYATSNEFPTSLSLASGGKGIPESKEATYAYSTDGTRFCLNALPKSSKVLAYYVSNTNLSPTVGQCSLQTGMPVSTLAGTGSVGFTNGASTVATFNHPAGLAVDTMYGKIFSTDQATSRIRTITLTGTVGFLAGNGSPGTTEGVGSAAQFNWPQALTVGPTGDLYVADSENDKIRYVPIDGSTSTSTFAGTGTAGFANGGPTVARFNVPRGIVYNPITSRIIVADSQNHLIRSVTLSGDVSTLAGQTATGGWADGTGTNARFNYPQGLAVDSNGNIIVADTLGHRIRKISTSGEVTTIAGSGSAGFADGNGLSAQFSSPMGVTLDTSNNIYVADTNNHRIRKITTTGGVTTIAGNGTAGYQDGNDALFNTPQSIVYGGNKLYITDRINQRIRVITLN